MGFRGRVLDADSGEPLSKAVVQVNKIVALICTLLIVDIQSSLFHLIGNMNIWNGLPGADMTSALQGVPSACEPGLG